MTRRAASHAGRSGAPFARPTGVAWTPTDALTLALGARQRPALAARQVRADPEVSTLHAAWDALGLPPRDLGPARRAAVDMLDLALRRGQRVLGWTCPEYPPPLLTLPDPPLALWIRGDASALSAPAVALVGSRAARPAAVEVATAMAADLARCGVVVVSGLARGVDAAAHRGALTAGRTVAVLGTGLDRVYPVAHTALADAVALAGALVTEFVPGTPPRAHHFPLRNRILSGLAQAVVVVEASDRSGSLITARLALEQGRDVMVVPGDVRGGANRGGHALLRDGARLVESAADVLDELGWRPSPARPGAADAAPSTGTATPPAMPPVLAALHRSGGLTLDDLARSTGTSAPILLRDLLDFELAGLVVRDGTGRYVPAERKW